MNWDDVRYFLQLMRDGSLSEASRTLAVEHTTIARRVAALESSLGVRLFDRLPRGWRLTSDGRELIPLAEAVEKTSLELERRATSSVGGTVRVSTAPVIATHFLVPRLPAFLARHPEITLEVETSRQASNLLRGEADIALRVGARDVPPGLVIKDIGRVGYGLYASSRMRPSASRVFVGFDDTMRDTAQKQWLDAQAKGCRVVFRTNDLLAQYAAARAGVGIALLPHLLVQAEDELVAVPVDGPPFERPLSVLFHPNIRRAKNVAAVLRFLTEEAKREAVFLTSGPRRRRTARLRS